MPKTFASLTVFLVVGITLFVACANDASTPATRTPIPRATKTIQFDAPPLVSPFGSSGLVNTGARTNPERFGGYNTNLNWLFKTGGQIRTKPSVSGDTVYIGSDGDLGTPGLYAINTETGEQLWNFSTKTVVQSSPAIVDGVVYFGSRDRNFYALDGHFYSVDAETGQEIWRLAIERTKQQRGISIVDSSPAVSGGVVYFGSLGNHLYAVDTKSGQEKWRFRIGGGVFSSPLVADGVAYVGSWDWNVYAVDIDTGEEK